MNLYGHCGVTIDPELIGEYDERNKKLPFIEQYKAQTKKDGIWGAIVKQGGITNIYSRSGKNKIESVPEFAKNTLPDSSIIIGELMFGSQRATDEYNKTGTRMFYAFDVIRWNGRNWNIPLLKRSNYCTAIFNNTIPNYFFPGQNVHLESLELKTLFGVKEVYDRVIEMGEEGVVLKKLDSPYIIGDNPYWHRCKPNKTWDVVIMGYTESNSQTYINNGWIGAVEVGLYIDGVLKKVCQVGGMSHEIRDFLSKNKESMIGRVLEISAFKQFKSGSFRHPAIKCIREVGDKRPEECIFSPAEI